MRLQPRKFNQLTPEEQKQLHSQVDNTMKNSRSFQNAASPRPEWTNANPAQMLMYSVQKTFNNDPRAEQVARNALNQMANRGPFPMTQQGLLRMQMRMQQLINELVNNPNKLRLFMSGVQNQMQQQQPQQQDQTNLGNYFNAHNPNNLENNYWSVMSGVLADQSNQATQEVSVENIQHYSNDYNQEMQREENQQENEEKMSEQKGTEFSQDHYQTLGAEKDDNASMEVLTEVTREKVFESALSNKLTPAAAAAGAVLGNKEKRQEYDSLFEHSNKAGLQNEPSRSQPTMTA